MSIGKQLLKLRTDLKLSREDASEKIGDITSRTLEKYESDITSPDAITLKRIARAYNSTVAFIVEEISDPAADALDALKKYQAEIQSIKTRRSFAEVNYEEANEMNMTTDDIREELAKMRRRAERIATEEAIEKLQKELLRREGEKLPPQK